MIPEVACGLVARSSWVLGAQVTPKVLSLIFDESTSGKRPKELPSGRAKGLDSHLYFFNLCKIIINKNKNI